MINKADRYMINGEKYLHYITEKRLISIKKEKR